MAIAGSLTYDTKLDTKGFQSGLNKIGGIAKGVAIGVGASITAIGAGLGVLTKKAIDNYAEYEQLVGGVDTLFGLSKKEIQKMEKVYGKSFDKIKEEMGEVPTAADEIKSYAAEAYKTAQISANQYMSTVTSFSASLLVLRY